MYKPIVALCYDFDHTLSPRDMQEYGYIGSLGMTPEEFWGQAEDLRISRNMDAILAYMYTMINEAKKRGMTVTEAALRAQGKNIELYNGVREWFPLINALGDSIGVEVEHYIISCGIKEIIEGSEIAKYFKEIYAGSFFYEECGAVWPRQAVNFTTKTQYLFSINKNLKDEKVNDFLLESERRIPFSRMIYLGDSATDIPCMRLVRANGGKSIGVYQPGSEVGLRTVNRLLSECRIDYYAEADYSVSSSLFDIVKKVLTSIKADSDLEQVTKSLKK